MLFRMQTKKIGTFLILRPTSSAEVFNLNENDLNENDSLEGDTKPPFVLHKTKATQADFGLRSALGMEVFFRSYSIQDQMNKHNLIIGMFRDKSTLEVKQKKGKECFQGNYKNH